MIIQFQYITDVVRSVMISCQMSAKDYRLKPMTPATIAEREEAKRLSMEMTRISVELEKLFEENNECLKANP